ncbi:MAG: hypothetical protein D6677_01615 [Calditrichaeota bacterium]|nr:MAG: hypothetical protein D6677_01615 [Calditrichota bacterium]
MLSKDDLNLKGVFPLPTEDAWRAAVDKLLNGKPFHETLFSTTEEGLELAPIYNEAKPDTLSVQSSDTVWIAQRLFCDNSAFNAKARHVLTLGQNALRIDLDIVSQWGSHPPFWPSNCGLIHLPDADVFKQLTDELAPDVPIFFDALSRPLEIARIIKASGRTLIGTAGADPVSGALLYGGFPESWVISARETRQAALPITQSGGALFTLRGDLIHDSGGNKVQELAYLLGLSALYIRTLGDAAPAMDWWWRTAIGNDQFAEIAKLRAMRLLWYNLLDGFGCAPEEYSLKIDAATSWRFMSYYDPWVNMIRSTGQAFSAITGGCDALEIVPFDRVLGMPDDFSIRQARNTAIILLRESYLRHVHDPAAGSWYLDTLTHQLAVEAWRLFQKMEREGGLLTWIRDGRWQQAVSANARQQQAAYHDGTRKAVGSTIYPNPDEKRPAKPTVSIPVEPVAGSAGEAIEPLQPERVLEKEDAIRRDQEAQHA